MGYDAYRHGREMTLSHLHSSLRIRENGYGGILHDLRLSEWVLEDAMRKQYAPEFRAGVQSVVRECQTALLTYGRD